ncbi:hypothetical protein [Lentibacillus saliphilus]|uniref:hypothetical protein n=1 Tax=Lentibacillus saliphilus TaxID=2737028 RepID=UPI001C2F6F98|nr:hypothetical protein [Lentibacillus saliphilus]
MRQLFILGIKEEYIYAGIVLLCLVVCYFFVQPLVIWLVKARADAALSYLLSSLMILVLLLYVRPDLNTMAPESLLKIVLQCMGAFGGVVLVRNVYRRRVSKQKRSI